MPSSHSAIRIPKSALPAAVRPRDNPFRSERIDALAYRPEGWTWEALLAQLEAMDFRAAVVGPHGSGKTTLLASLVPRLVARGFTCRACRLRRGERDVPPDLLVDAGRSDILIVDGADLLSRAAWRRVRRAALRAGGLVVACHREGLLPTLVECCPSLVTVGAVVDELNPGGVPRDLLAALFDRHGGNVRSILRELYDLCATD